MKIIKLFLIILLCSSSAFATPDVNKRVDEIFNRMKKEKSFAVMLDYVHWETAYSRLNPVQKATLGVNSADEYRSSVKTLMTNPGETVKKQMKGKMGTLPPEQQQMVEAMLAGQVQEMEAKMKQELEELSQSEYKIVSSEVNGKEAKVTVDLLKPSGDKERDDVQFELIDGEWYIPAADVHQPAPMH